MPSLRFRVYGSRYNFYNKMMKYNFVGREGIEPSNRPGFQEVGFHPTFSSLHIPFNALSPYFTSPTREEV